MLSSMLLKTSPMISTVTLTVDGSGVTTITSFKSISSFMRIFRLCNASAARYITSCKMATVPITYFMYYFKNKKQKKNLTVNIPIPATCTKPNNRTPEINKNSDFFLFSHIVTDTTACFFFFFFKNIIY